MLSFATFTSAAASLVGLSSSSPTTRLALALLFTLVVVAVVTTSLMPLFGFGSKKWEPKGKHCYVTGGSAGLGLGLAIVLTQRGAHVTIVARNEARLADALKQVEANRVSPTQKLQSLSHALNDASEAAKALDAAAAAHGGRAPDAVFLCAGSAHPGFFVEETGESMRQGMEDVYWVSSLTALAAVKKYVRDGTQGKIVFVASMLSYFSLVGYSTYSPAKHALRGLAETLRSEFKLYPNISVHILFPGTIYSPGYIEENRTKPKISLKIEERDVGMQPVQIAEELLKGIQRDEFHITYDFNGNVFRAGTRGATPWNNVLIDVVYELIAVFGVPDWRRGVDKLIIGHREEHRAYLAERGLVGAPPTSDGHRASGDEAMNDR